MERGEGVERVVVDVVDAVAAVAVAVVAGMEPLRDWSEEDRWQDNSDLGILLGYTVMMTVVAGMNRNCYRPRNLDRTDLLVATVKTPS